MISIGVVNTGVMGIQGGLNDLEREANQIARAGHDDPSSENVVESLVELEKAERQVGASAKVVKAAVETQDTLFEAWA
ncbi:MAG: flagellar biosynthesis protein FlgE [Halieaceae bacterium]|jgi:hypothetical protein|nr:flagellar biosynthesis protein FlgE [Halieaceae bacterium]